MLGAVWDRELGFVAGERSELVPDHLCRPRDLERGPRLAERGVGQVRLDPAAAEDLERELAHQVVLEMSGRLDRRRIDYFGVGPKSAQNRLGSRRVDDVVSHAEKLDLEVAENLKRALGFLPSGRRRRAFMSAGELHIGVVNDDDQRTDGLKCESAEKTLIVVVRRDKNGLVRQL